MQKSVKILGIGNSFSVDCMEYVYKILKNLGVEDIKLGMVEARFADLVWQRAPLTTKELVALCEKELHWKAQFGIEEMCASQWKWQSGNPVGYEK